MDKFEICIPPGALQSTRLQRVKHDWSDLACMLSWQLSAVEGSVALLCV